MKRTQNQRSSSDDDFNWNHIVKRNGKYRGRIHTRNGPILTKPYDTPEEAAQARNVLRAAMALG